MKGFICIDKNFLCNENLLNELFSSDAFRNSSYSIRLNCEKPDADILYDLMNGTEEDITPLLRFRLLLQSLGYCDIPQYYDNFDYTNYGLLRKRINKDLLLNSVICVPKESSEMMRQMHENYGISYITPAKKRICEHMSIPIERDRKLDWKTLLPNNCWNAMIMIDPYILSDKQKISNNLIPIIQSGMSSALGKKDLQVTIYTSNDYWKEAEDFINEQCPGIQVEIISELNHRDIHDRELIMNNYYLNCPAGFDLFQERSPFPIKRSQIIIYKYPQFNEAIKESFDSTCNFLRNASNTKNRLLNQQ